MSPEVIAHLDAIKVNMNEAGMNAINIVLAFVMFGVALGIKPKTFVEIAKKPQSIFLGITCQPITLPLTWQLSTVDTPPSKRPTIPPTSIGILLSASVST